MPCHPRHTAGTFQVPSLTISNPCCLHWDILGPFLPHPQSLLPAPGHTISHLSSPVSFPSRHHGVTGSSYHWSCIEAAISCPWISCGIPSQMPAAQPRSKEQDRPSPALALHLRQPCRYPRTYLPFSYLPREAGWWWVGSGSLSGSGGHAGTHEVSTLLHLPR